MTGSEKSQLELLVDGIGAASTMQRRAVESALEALTQGERLELQSYLEFCTKEGWGIDQLVGAYMTITHDTMREQIFFQRNGQYRHSSFDSVASNVYFDTKYMSSYMYGLALTLFLWPNHLQIVRFFRDMLPRKRGGTYLEVGPGHGAFFRYAVRYGGFDTCVGVDISPTSLQMTRKLLESDTSLDRARWELMNTDFLAATTLHERYDAIVMGEVLEHVEEPLKFLERIRDLAAKNAFIFITTAINAPAIDHIYLFRTVEEVRDLVTAAGMTVRDVLATPYTGCSMEETVQKKLPINVAMVLKA